MPPPSSDENFAADERARGDRALIFLLGALSTVSPFAIDTYLAAFPEIATDLGTTPSRLALSLSSYFIGLSIGQIAYGPLLDRYGRKKPLGFGLLLFILASLACTRSGNVETLIALRFVQGLGGCVAQVAAMAMVRDFFPVADSARIFSRLMLMIGVSPLLAPTVGAAVSGAFGWRLIFFGLAGVGAVLLAIVHLRLPEAHIPDPSVSLRPGPIVRGFRDVFRVPEFRAYGVAGALSFSGLFAYIAGSPTIFLETFGVSPKGYGLLFAVLTGAFIGGSQLNLLLGKRIPGERIFRVGLVLQMILSGALLAGAILGHLEIFTLAAVPTAILFFLILGTVGVTNPNAAALALAPFERNVGSASALFGFLQIGAGALASAGVGLFTFGGPMSGLLPTAILLAFGGTSALLVLTRFAPPEPRGRPRAHS